MTTELDQHITNDTAPAARRRLPGDRRAVANQEPTAAVTPTTASVTADLTPEPPPADGAPPPASPWADGWPAPATAGLPVAVRIDTPQEKEAPATWGRRRTVIRVLSVGLVKPKPGAEELDYRRNCTLLRTTQWPRSVKIAVVNDKGGVNKTPTALILGGIIAEQGRPVAIWDAGDQRGTLTERAEGAPSRCVSVIEEAPGDYRTPGTIGAVAAKQSSFADVFGSLTAREFSADSIRRVAWALDRTYQVQVADTGNVPHSDAFQEVIEQADILVVPTTVTADSVSKAVRLLERLQSTGLTANAVVALTRYGGPETPGLYPQLAGVFQAVGVGAVIEIPFDPVIARGTTINTRSLSRPSRLAWTRLATAVVSNLHVRDNPTGATA